MTYAEVIGSPIGHSLSPLIHRYWLQRAGVRGDYRATRVERESIADYLCSRRTDPGWHGCNVTAPLKEMAAGLVDRLDPGAAEIGAVNLLWRDGAELVGCNSDVDGVDEALTGARVEGGKVVILGGGGAARAAIAAVRRSGAGEIIVAMRDPARAPPGVAAVSIDAAERPFAGADVVINATPIGFDGSPVPAPVLDALPAAAGAVLLDMVYRPLATPLLKAGAAAGLVPVDGLVMLIGQARRSFAAFFGTAASSDDAGLRALLVEAIAE